MVYNERLRQPLYYQLGEYETDLQLLAAIPRSRDGLPELSLPTAQAWTLLYAAMCYERTGQLRLGLGLIDIAIQLNRRSSNGHDLASSLVPYSMLCCDVGQLQLASNSARESVSIFDRIGNSNWRGISHRSYGRVLMLCGRFDRALEEFSVAASAYSSSPGFAHGRSVLLAYKAQLCLLQNVPSQALELAQQANKLSQLEPLKREGVVATWLLGAALVALASEERDRQGEVLVEAEAYLTKALRRCRRINLIETEPNILLELARLRHAQAREAEALSLAQEALDIADRCQYRLVQADCHNFLAELAYEVGGRHKAREHAETARERAWCDGPPHRYEAAFQEAERLLERLGVSDGR